jgi:hypothetical protein
MRNYVHLFVVEAFQGANPFPPPDFFYATTGVFGTREEAQAFSDLGWDHVDIWETWVKLDKYFVELLMTMGSSFSAITPILDPVNQHVEQNILGYSGASWTDTFKQFLQAGADFPANKYGNVFLAESPRKFWSRGH